MGLLRARVGSRRKKGEIDQCIVAGDGIRLGGSSSRGDDIRNSC